jgi:hypothetical protein
LPCAFEYILKSSTAHSSTPKVDMPIPISDTGPVQNPATSASGAQASGSPPNDPTANNQDSPDLPTAAASRPVDGSPIAAGEANPPSPIPDSHIVPGENSAEPRDDHVGVQAKAHPKAKGFQPSKAKTARYAS